MLESKKIILCDLDQTLIKINSYHHWIFFCLIVSLITLKISIIFKIIRLFKYKNQGLLSRWEVKKQIITIVSNSNILCSLTQNLFSKYLSIFTRNKIINELEKNKNNTIIVTAAFIGYCKFLEKLGFFVIGTELGKDENIGKKKLDSVKEFLSNKYILLYTDHYDDIPLAKISQQVILVNPSKETIKKYIEEEIEFITWS